MFYFFLNILYLISFIICVPFLIFYERRLLALFQLRYGLFIYFFNSFFIFISDFLKILSKYNIFIFSYNFLILFIICFIFVLITLLIFFFFPFFSFYLIIFFYYPLILIIFLSFIPFFFSLLIYLSNSIYSYIGNLRSVFLLISYELLLNFCLITILIINLSYFFINSYYLNLILFFIIFIFFICLISDASRLPFDLIEGESEIVSGFNTELSLTLFLLVFFGEYILFFLFIIFLSYLFNLLILYFLFIFVFIRALFVRFFFYYIIVLF